MNDNSGARFRLFSVFQTSIKFEIFVFNFKSFVFATLFTVEIPGMLIFTIFYCRDLRFYLRPPFEHSRM